MEFKSFNFDLKAVDDDKNIFEGYASVFRNKDSHGDIIEPNAFAKTIQERGHRVKVLWQHDMFTPIGKAIHLEEDNHGLFVRAKISETEEGKKAMTLIKDGVIDELSIGYSVIKDEYDNETGIRHLKELKLYEFSPVTFASNDQAIITGVKNEGELTRYLYRLNRDLKAGRVLSGKNRSLVQKAIDALQELLDASDDSKDSNIDINNDINYNNNIENNAKEIARLIDEIKHFSISK